MPARTCWGYRNSGQSENHGTLGMGSEASAAESCIPLLEQSIFPRRIPTGLYLRNGAASIDKHIKWV